MTAGVLDGNPEPVDEDSDLAAPEGAARDSMSVAAWTVVNRFTGVLRGITIKEPKEPRSEEDYFNQLRNCPR